MYKVTSAKKLSEPIIALECQEHSTVLSSREKTTVMPLSDQLDLAAGASLDCRSPLSTPAIAVPSCPLPHIPKLDTRRDYFDFFVCQTEMPLELRNIHRRYTVL